MNRIVIWENLTLVREICTEDYILEYPALMPLHCVMQALKDKGYDIPFESWRHMV